MGERHAYDHDSVVDPGRNGPICDRHVNGKEAALILGAVTGLGVKVIARLMPQGFGDAIDRQSHADTNSKDHGEITKVGVFRFLTWCLFLVASHVKMAIFVANKQDKEEQDRLGTLKDPAACQRYIGAQSDEGVLGDRWLDWVCGMSVTITDCELRDAVLVVYDLSIDFKPYLLSKGPIPTTRQWLAWTQRD